MTQPPPNPYITEAERLAVAEKLRDQRDRWAAQPGHRASFPDCLLTLCGVCARPPVDAGRWAFLFVVSHFLVGGDRIHAHIIAR
jgi:hypothetical protein